MALLERWTVFRCWACGVSHEERIPLGPEMATFPEGWAMAHVPIRFWGTSRRRGFTEWVDLAQSATGVVVCAACRERLVEHLDRLASILNEQLRSAPWPSEKYRNLVIEAQTSKRGPGCVVPMRVEPAEGKAGGDTGPRPRNLGQQV